MAISSVSGTNAAANQLGMESLMKILMTQLTYQDPMKPMDNQQFMSQIAQFTNLQQTQLLNDKMEQLISTQSSLQSVGLIGRTVEVITDSGKVAGTVASLSFSNETPLLTVRTTTGELLSNVAFSKISSVR